MTNAPKDLSSDSDGLTMRRRLNEALFKMTGLRVHRITPKPDQGDRRLETLPEPVDAKTLAAAAARTVPGDRLMTAPVFVLSSVRSGSTLLRLVLDSHPQICSPHELHLRRVIVSARGHAAESLDEVGLDTEQLRYLLWDRILHRELTRSGKTVFVNKTPTDALMWSDLISCWPDSKFIFLRRHPGAITDSWGKARFALDRDEVARDIYAYLLGMEQAQQAHGGLVVRYEDLTADPAGEAARICAYLGVDFDPAMIEYGRAQHEGMRRGLGDWSDRVRSGSVQPAPPLPPAEDVPELLVPTARAWGYLD